MPLDTPSPRSRGRTVRRALVAGVALTLTLTLAPGLDVAAAPAAPDGTGSITVSFEPSQTLPHRVDEHIHRALTVARLGLPTVRDQIAARCPAIDDERVLPMLMRTARTHDERWARVAAVSALGGARGPLAEPVFRQLCQSLGDPSFSVRAAAARALAAMGDARARHHLIARRDIEAHRSVLLAIDESLQALE